MYDPFAPKKHNITLTEYKTMLKTHSDSRKYRYDMYTHIDEMLLKCLWVVKNVGLIRGTVGVCCKTRQHDTQNGRHATQIIPSWPDGTKCTSADFVAIYTDFGLCYAINTDKDKAHTVGVAGETHGLQILFDVAIYDRITGPSNTDGMKVRWLGKVPKPLFGFR